MDKRIVYRKKRRKGLSPEKQARVAKKLLSVFLFFLCLWSFIVFIRSDFFTLERILFSGNNHTGEEELRTAMGVSEGENIWRLSPSRLESGLETIPRIKSAEVHRKLPRRLLVNVTEKEALVLIPYQEYMLETGVDGQILGTTQEPQNYGLPLLTGLPLVETTVGDTVLAGEVLGAVKEIISALSGSGVSLSEINVADSENIIVVTIDGLVSWLGKDQLEQKTKLMANIAGQIAGRHNNGYLDLRVPDAPVFHNVRNNK